MSDPFLDNQGSNGASTTFNGLPVGHVMRMRVTGSPTSIQAKDFSTKEPSFWHPSKKGAKTTTPNDRPVMLAVIPCEAISGVNTKDGEIDAGEPCAVMATIWGSDLFFKIDEARQVNGAKYAIKDGDEIAVKLAERVPTSGSDKNVHLVKITPGQPSAAKSDPFDSAPTAQSSAPAAAPSDGFGDEPPF